MSALSDLEFADRMAVFAPFEARPHLAVGVSGGRDSLALTLLADRWARPRGGAVLGLTVDHGLRPEAAREAAQVGAWLAARGIAHRVLTWTGAKPRHGIQAAARTARRELLTSHCRGEGILHLLLAHQQDDQAETMVMRLAADSGPDGLAGMAAVAETADLRVLRPLLDVPRARLAATLTELEQSWIEDPSNDDPRFSRSRVRGLIGGAEPVAAPAAGLARERGRREAAVAELLARTVTIYPEGWALLALGVFTAASAEVARRALARLLMCIGGDAYPPRGTRLDRLYAAICRGRLAGGRTLAGCRLVPRREAIAIVRETAAVAGPQAVGSGGWQVWDGRFRVELAGRRAPQGMALQALGRYGGTGLAKPLRSHFVPALVAPTLPALYDLEGLVEVPHLTYRRKGADPDSVTAVSASFRPRHVLAGAGFAGVSPDPGEIGGDHLMANRRKDQAYAPSAGDVRDGGRVKARQHFRE